LLSGAGPPAKEPAPKKAAADGGVRQSIEARQLAELERLLPPGGLDAGPMLPPRPLFVWDIPNVESVIEVPDLVWIDTIPVKLKQVIVKGKMEDVLRGIYDSFVRAGLYVQDPRKQPTLSHHEQLTGLDPVRFISYTVMAQPVDDKRVNLILGEANVGFGAAMAKKPRDQFAPAYPGATGLVTSTSEGLRTMTYSAPGTEAQVRDFYAKELPRAGYKLVEGGVFRGAADELRIQVKTEAGKSTVLVSQRPLPKDEGFRP
jgi:hypothetical protein